MNRIGRRWLLFVLFGVLVGLITLSWLYFFQVSKEVTNNTIKIVWKEQGADQISLREGVILRQLFAFLSLALICFLSILVELLKKHILRVINLDLREKMLQKLALLQPTQFKKLYPDNRLFIKLERDLSDYVSRRINAYLDLINGWVYILFTTTFLLLLHWSLAVSVILLSLSFSISRSFFTKSLYKRREEFQAARTNFLSELNTYLEGFEMLSSLGKESLLRERLLAPSKAEAATKRRENFITESRSYTTNLYLNLLREISLLLLFLALIFNIFQGYLTPGIVVVVTGIFFQLVSRFNQINLAPGQLKIARMLLKDIDITIPIKQKGSFEIKGGFNLLNLSKVGLSYEREVILKEIDLKIAAGEKVLIVGRSGAGKTSLLRLITGFEPSYSGSVTINGKELREIGVGVHNLFALSSSDEIVFNDSVRENICLWEEVDIKRLREVLRVSNLNLDLLNANCLSLSLGQKARILLARALLSDRPVVILDETLSALDEVTLRRVVKNLKEDELTTYILVSHRPLCEELFDKVIRLE